jgi:hypothetical protein
MALLLIDDHLIFFPTTKDEVNCISFSLHQA